MTILKIIFGLITAVLRAATSSLVLMISLVVTAVAILLVVGFFACGVTGAASLRLSRRREQKEDRAA